MNGATEKPRLGFLGAGWIGRHRLEAILRGSVAEVAAVVDPVPENVDAVRAIAPGVIESPNLQELCRMDLDGIVIATPSALHAEQSIYALEQGFAVFCQKPLARNAAEVDSVIRAARRADRLLGVDLSYRYVRGLLAIRDLVQRDVLGNVFAADLVFHNAYGPGKPWFYDRALSGGGCVVDLGIHLVDAALWILRSPVAHLTSHLCAEGRALPPGAQAIEDYANVHLRLESGTLVNLSCSWQLHAGQDAVIEASFYGTEGGACLRNINGSFTEFRADHFVGTTRRTLAEPPDAWGGGAILAWASELQESNRFNPAIEEHADVARVLDTIYGEPEVAAGRL